MREGLTRLVARRVLWLGLTGALLAASGCEAGGPAAVEDGGTPFDSAPPDAQGHAAHDASPDGPIADAAPASCSIDPDCDDGDECTGVERCVGGECVAGDPVTCTPTDVCHTSTCDPSTGTCNETLIDEDLDGEASSSLGACGTDCDDARADVYSASVEITGDLVDQNCDGAELCFVDADRDGFRGATTVSSPDLACTTTNGEAGGGQPADCNDSNASIHEGTVEMPGDEIDQNCDGSELCFADADHDGYRAWALVTSSDTDCADPGEARTSVTVECCDADARAFPGQTQYFAASAGPSACGGWDFDCSGGADRRFTSLASCFLGSGSVPMCMFGGAGWNATVPACGASGSWVTNCTGSGSCSKSMETREQECR